MVTGAGQGLGEAIARRLAAEGALLALADINHETVQSVASSLDEPAFATDVDVRSPGPVPQPYRNASGSSATVQAACYHPSSQRDPRAVRPRFDSQVDRQTDDNIARRRTSLKLDPPD